MSEMRRYGRVGSIVVDGVEYAVEYRRESHGNQTIAIAPDGVEHILCGGIASKKAWRWMLELVLEGL